MAIKLKLNNKEERKKNDFESAKNSIESKIDFVEAKKCSQIEYK